MDTLDTNFFEQLFDELVKIAKEDNVITPDEQAILDKTRKNINEFKELYDKAMEDNVITEDEYTILHKAHSKIYSDSETEALRDSKITEEEVKLIAKIAHTLFGV